MPRRSSEAGFTLLAFMMVIAIMSIMMAVAVQAVSFQMRREREAELIFRGEQYVEAIRLYKVKYGRSPMRLKELWDVKPKVIRKKWKDPITDSMKWGLIFEGDLGGRGGAQGRAVRRGSNVLQNEQGATGRGPVPTGTPTFGRDGDGQGVGPDGRAIFPVSGDGTDGETGQPTRVGAIIGVHSTSCDESIKEYDARNTYCEWRFIFKDRNQQQGGGRRGMHGSGPGGRRGGAVRAGGLDRRDLGDRRRRGGPASRVISPPKPRTTPTRYP